MVFNINGLIGEGGFGRVMTAKYDVTQQWYAVKEIVKVSFYL
jgi:serine/threonine protein kinase